MIHKIVAGYISSKYGSMVSDQYTDWAVNGQDLESQNYNALKYIFTCIQDLTTSDCFNEDRYDELVELQIELESYLNN